MSEFPVTVLTGPRQSGKTTLLRHLSGGEHGYVSLDLPDVRDSAEEDPRSFLARFPPPAICDEVQFAPGLLPYVKERTDEDRGRTGQFLLSGSQNLLLNEQITESLPGRAAILHLLPMSGMCEASARSATSGGFGAFSGRLPRARAAAQLSDIARDLGVAVDTAKAWLSTYCNVFFTSSKGGAKRPGRMHRRSNAGGFVHGLPGGTSPGCSRGSRGCVHGLRDRSPRRLGGRIGNRHIGSTSAK